MQGVLILFVSAIVIALIVTVISYRSLQNRSKELSKKLNQATTYREKASSDQVPERGSTRHEGVFEDIPTALNKVFDDQIISATQEKDFINYYESYFKEANALVKKLKSFHIKPSVTISNLVRDFGEIHSLVKQHNEVVIRLILDTYQYFFDHCLQYPLDKQQRRAIISEEDNCLVVSSAGSGKTTTIVGKVKYLTEIKDVAPSKILLISFTRKAAAELTERMSTEGLKGYTFHRLALDIIGKATGKKPSICDNTEALFINIYRNLLENREFKHSVLEYFKNWQTEEADWEQRKNERREKLSELKRFTRKALLPDMDNKIIFVRSEQEQKICFALSSLGVQFRYEDPYEHPLADEMYTQYRPDFSIYFEQKGETKRIYLEHFGVNEQGLVPAWFAKDKNITYEEANRVYHDSITWKRAAHEKFGTQLLVTTSADFRDGEIKDTLKKLLEDAGVPIQEKTDEELYDLVLPKGSKQEKLFIRLVATFVKLVKSSCKSIEEVLKQAKRAGDKRTVFIIKNIFQPIYERYRSALIEREQIDFTDAILQATEICRKTHPVEYDYIIVDEFQDISIDRYNFLKALREGNPPAKLYCVGDDWQSIYRFNGSDMALFNQFSEYFGATEINKIETTYRFGEPLVAWSSQFIQRNKAQIEKEIHSFRSDMKTELEFHAYDILDYCNNYCNIIGKLVDSIPSDKSIYLLGRYNYDDYYLSYMYQSIKEENRFFYEIGGRKIEFLTVHKSKGLEADYVILLQCNKDTHGFPCLMSGDPVLNYVLTKSDEYPYGEERRLFYVAITRAKLKTFVLYDRRFPSVFVDEFLHPEKLSEESYVKHPNANKRWTRKADQFLLQLHNEGKSVKYIADKMGRSQTSIVMRLNKLTCCD